MLDILITIRDTFNHHIVFGIGILLVVGYYVGKLAEKVRLPAITGYIIAGVLLGDSMTGLIHAEMTDTLRNITDVALGIIAITIGSEFSAAKLRRLGPGILIITIVQLLFTFLVVSGVLLLFGMESYSAFLLGAIGSATAPAATVVIIQNLRARGDFVDTLYGVVALDDAGCVIIFAGVFALIGGMLGVGEGAGGFFLATLGHAAVEISLSVLLGLAEGVVMHILTFRITRPNALLIILLGLILLFTAIAISLHLSPLLANMVAGAVIINLSRRGNRIFQAIRPLTPPLYAAFFAIAGTELNLGLLGNWWILLLGSIYVISRGVGKYSGVWLGAQLAGTDRKTRDYLGFSMIPQAGVAIGLVLLIQASPLLAGAPPPVAASLARIVNIVLFAVMINELIGPPLSKMAIIKGAEL
ncbi:MAG: cation:proton antiporter [Candidatus Euphemobacter frigidus]|nr:cation:proton antiporter [Candidatus Euphemobacter frigidus]MDP8276528.1 cation:proton antiporter [Candidatus Euphemobacter frigidus]